MDESLGHTIRVGDIVEFKAEDCYKDSNYNGQSGIVVIINAPYSVFWIYPPPENLSERDQFYVSKVPSETTEKLGLPKDAKMYCVSTRNMEIVGSLNPEFYEKERT